jgi:hypothetical protein
MWNVGGRYEVLTKSADVRAPDRNEWRSSSACLMALYGGGFFMVVVFLWWWFLYGGGFLRW